MRIHQVKISVELTPAQCEYLRFLEFNKVKAEDKEFVSQNEAYRRFGRGNVERWVKLRKIKQYKRPTRIEHSLKELLNAAYTVQDYFE